MEDQDTAYETQEGTNHNTRAYRLGAYIYDKNPHDHQSSYPIYLQGVWEGVVGGCMFF